MGQLPRLDVGRSNRLPPAQGRFDGHHFSSGDAPSMAGGDFLRLIVDKDARRRFPRTLLKGITTVILERHENSNFD